MAKTKKYRLGFNVLDILSGEIPITATDYKVLKEKLRKQYEENVNNEEDAFRPSWETTIDVDFNMAITRDMIQLGTTDLWLKKLECNKGFYFKGGR